MQWRLSTDGGKTFTDIPGATSGSLNVTAVAGQGTLGGQNGDMYLAAFTNSSGTVSTTAATLTVQVPPQISANGNPQNQSVNVGQKATFTAVETGGSPLPKVQWQVSTDNGLSFSNLTSGVTVATTATTGGETSTLSFTTTAAQTGYLYQAVFSNHSSATTTAASLTVTNTKPIIVGQPVNQSVVPGQSVMFTATATGNPTPTVQWMVSTNGGKTFSPINTGVGTSDIPNGVSTTLTFASTLAQKGSVYEVVFSNSAGNVTSKAATLSEVAAPVVTEDLQSVSVAPGHTATFTAAATGYPAPSVQWQLSTDGGNTFTYFGGGKATTKFVNGVETATLSVTAIPEVDGYQFLAVFYNSTYLAFTSPATLTVPFAPKITVQPAGQNSTAGGQATFTASSTGEPAPTTVQWMVSTDKGKTWQSVPDGTTTSISHGLSASLTLTNIDSSLNGAQYEAVFTAGSATVTTKAATLTLGTLPQVTSSGNPQNQSVVTGQKNVTFTAAATTGSPVAKVQWQVSTDGGVTFSPFTAGTVTTKTSGGVETTTLTLTAQANQNGNLFRAMFTNTIGAVPTLAATLSVASPPVVVDQPISQTVINGATATFAALAAGTPNPATVQWWISADGGKTFNAVSGTSTTDAFTGATGNIFTLTTSPDDEGKQYEFYVVFTYTNGTISSMVKSNVVTLTVE